VGNQKPDQFDNDNPPLIGMDGIKELVSIMWLLNKYGWKGIIEIDNHMLRSDTAPGSENSMTLRREYIELAVDAYRTLEAKANELVKDRQIAAAQSRPWDVDADIASLLTSGETEEIASVRVDYEKLVRKPLRLGALDLQVKKRFLVSRRGLRLQLATTIIGDSAES
jgi:hypothetical protein